MLWKDRNIFSQICAFYFLFLLVKKDLMLAWYPSIFLFVFFVMFFGTTIVFIPKIDRCLRVRNSNYFHGKILKKLQQWFMHQLCWWLNQLLNASIPTSTFLWMTASLLGKLFLAWKIDARYNGHPGHGSTNRCNDSCCRDNWFRRWNCH